MAESRYSYFVNWSHSNHTDTSIQPFVSGTELNVGEIEMDIDHCLNVLTITVILVALCSINRFLTWIKSSAGLDFPMRAPSPWSCLLAIIDSLTLLLSPCQK